MKKFKGIPAEELAKAKTKEEVKNLIRLYEVPLTEEEILQHEGKEKVEQLRRAKTLLEDKLKKTKKELDDIDVKSIRPIRENDVEFLAKLTDRARTLRERVRELETELKQLLGEV